MRKYECSRCGSEFFSSIDRNGENCDNCKNGILAELTFQETHICKFCKSTFMGPSGLQCPECDRFQYSVTTNEKGLFIVPKEGLNELDQIEAFLDQLDRDLVELGFRPQDLEPDFNETTMGPGPVPDLSSGLYLEECRKGMCSDCDAECDGLEASSDALASDQDMVQRIIEDNKKVVREIDETLQKNREEVDKSWREVNKRQPYNPAKPELIRTITKGTRAPKQYCRWCTHWERTDETLGNCRKTKYTGINAFESCRFWHRDQHARDKITHKRSRP